jgi:hypothetical protein
MCFLLYFHYYRLIRPINKKLVLSKPPLKFNVFFIILPIYNET